MKKKAFTCPLCGLRTYSERLDAAPYTLRLYLHEFGGNRKMAWTDLDDPVLSDELRKKLVFTLKECLRVLDEQEGRGEDSLTRKLAKSLGLNASAILAGLVTESISNMIQGHDRLKDLIILLGAMGFDLVGEQFGGLRGDVATSVSRGMDGLVGGHIADRYFSPKMPGDLPPLVTDFSAQVWPRTYLSGESRADLSSELPKQPIFYGLKIQARDLRFNNVF